MEVAEDLLEAHGHSKSDDTKSLKYTQSLGSGAEFPYLNMMVSTYRICPSLTLDDNRKVLEGSQEARRQVES